MQKEEKRLENEFKGGNKYYSEMLVHNQMLVYLNEKIAKIECYKTH